MIQRSLTVLICSVAICSAVLAQPPGRRANSPASSRVPATETPQTYAAELVEAGRTRFASQCGFCHGLDAAGGSSGPDLTRSELVAGDFRGDAISPVVRAGRANAEVPMPAFPSLSESDLESIVAFVHDQKTRAESAEGGRQSVSVEDVLSGDTAAGRRYFDNNCADCHSATGDLQGIAARVNGLNLMRLMLNPRSGRGQAVRSTPRVSVTTADNRTFTGLLDYQDEFTIALIEPDGRYRSFTTSRVRYEVSDPLERHFELLEQYTDKDLHDVLTYLHSLR